MSKGIGYVNISIKGKDVVVSANAPNNPKLGDLWYDTINNRLKRWTGVKWEAENSAELSGIQETLKTHSMDIIKNSEGISQLIKDTTIVSVSGKPVSIQEAYNYSVDSATEHSQLIAETKQELADDIQTEATRTTQLIQNLDGFKQEVAETFTETQNDITTQYTTLSSSITQTANSIRSEMSTAISNSESNTKEAYESYVEQTAENLEIGFSNSIKTETDRAIKAENNLSSKITVNSNSIKTEVERATAQEGKISTSVTQNANKISWMIKSGTSSSNMILTDKMLSVIAENINLTGKVTFACFDSSAQSKINAAQTTANTAVTNAATAQSTANGIASNIYLSGTTTINGGKIDTDSLYAQNATVKGALLLNGGYLTTNSNRKTYDSTVKGLTLDKNGIGGYSSSSQYFSLSATGKLICAGAVIKGEVHATSGSFSGNISADTLTLKTGIKINHTFIDGLSTVATSGKYSDLSGKPSIPTSVTQLTGGSNIMYTTDVSVGTSVTSNGLTKKTITVGGQSFTSIESGDFILTNVGIGTNTTDASKSYTYISKDGLLTAKNAVIYGTIYATNGQFSGTINAATITGGSIAGATITGGSINIGNGNFVVDASGSITAKKGSFEGAISINGKSNLDRVQIHTTDPTDYWGEVRSGEFYTRTDYEKCIVMDDISVTNANQAIMISRFWQTPMLQIWDFPNGGGYSGGSGSVVALSLSALSFGEFFLGAHVFGNTDACSYYGATNCSVKGTLYTASGSVSLSDRNLKNSISELEVEQSKAFINALVPCKYKYNSSKSDRYHHGFIAQDVKDAMNGDDWGVYIDTERTSSEDTTIAKEVTYKALRYEEIIADLVNVVQDQHNRISQLETKIETLLTGVSQ